jgi:hypothetical protein
VPGALLAMASQTGATARFAGHELCRVAPLGFTVRLTDARALATTTRRMSQWMITGRE